MPSSTQQKKILVAVLNWGLGHATRSTPLIVALQNAGYTPVLVSDGIALTYLQKQFPNLQSETLVGYNVTYSRFFLWSLFKQLPNIALAIKRENKQIALLAKKHNSVGIISDNRLGAYHKNLPSIYLTHQVNIRAGIFSAFAGWLHRQYIHKFTTCLIPDVEKYENSLAGDLSHRFKLNIPVEYIGYLSRFNDMIHVESNHKRYLACIILSGPEPSRTAWETELIKQAKHFKDAFVLIRGRLNAPKLNVPLNVQVVDLADELTLTSLLNQSEVLVSRSGYSSLMDYFYIDKPALLVPTPGQTEQEYLAKRVGEKFAVQWQREFNLKEGILQAKAKKQHTRHSTVKNKPDYTRLFSLFEGK